GNLDTVTAETIFNIFEKLVARGKTVIMVTHDESLSSRFSRRVQILDGVLYSDEKAQSDGGGSQLGQRNPAGGESGHEPILHQTKIKRRNSVVQANKKDHPAVVIQNVVKTYVNAAGEFPALKGIDMQFDYGEFISIVGKSGSGKSTLLNMITGIDRPTDGKIIIENDDLYAMNESQRSLWRGRNMGIVFQFFQLLPTLNLLENTMLPMDYTNTYEQSERPAKAMELLKMVGLEEQAYSLPTSVSSGQQQTAAIARAIATDAPIIVADEPTGNLDSRSAEVILNLFETLVQRGKTILIVTHDPSITSRTDHTVILSDGEVIDPYIAQAFPMLNHPEMLAVTKTMGKKSYYGGEKIFSKGDIVDNLYIVSNGEVIVQHPNCPDQALATLGPGDFFGEIELANGQKAIASVVAGSAENVKLNLLSKEMFDKLLKTSPSTEKSFAQAVQKHADEHKAKL
ncbi:MAG: ATP-binding cassette domain-containing protein, partial [Chloroflexota bacterium]